MKKVLLTLLAVVLTLGALGAAGMTGYRFGYAQGLSAGSDGEIQLTPRGFGMGPQRMPGHNFGFQRGEFGRGGFPMGRGMGFGFFAPLWFLLQLAFWGLVIYAIYNLIAQSGWRLTRTTTTSTVPPATTTTTETEVKE